MSQITEVSIAKLFIGKSNVRKNVGDISELVDSIRQVGILEPLIVRPVAEDRYEIVVGNRRFNAAKVAGLERIPCLVKEMTDDEAIIASLTENIQRGDISEEEIAEAYTILHNINPKKWTQTVFARNVGKSQQWVSNLLVAYQSLVKLRQSGVVSGMRSYPREHEREAGIAPVKHLMDIEFAMRSEEVKRALPDNELQKKRVELAKAVIKLPQEDAKQVIDRFKMYPEKPIEEIREEALSKKTGVMLKTYLPPRIARELDRVAEERQTSLEEVLPDVVRKGLERERAPREVKKEMGVKEGIIYTVGDYECPHCKRHYVIKCDGKRDWVE